MQFAMSAFFTHQSCGSYHQHTTAVCCCTQHNCYNYRVNLAPIEHNAIVSCQFTTHKSKCNYIRKMHNVYNMDNAIYHVSVHTCCQCLPHLAVWPICTYTFTNCVCEFVTQHGTSFSYLSRHLQQHLSDEDFLIAFNMSRENFAGLTKWKKIELKKKANLFWTHLAVGLCDSCVCTFYNHFIPLHGCMYIV